MAQMVEGKSGPACTIPWCPQSDICLVQNLPVPYGGSDHFAIKSFHVAAIERPKAYLLPECQFLSMRFVALIAAIGDENFNLCGVAGRLYPCCIHSFPPSHHNSSSTTPSDK
jgi:hypothetical protein